jgi:hypothetical protein
MTCAQCEDDGGYVETHGAHGCDVGDGVPYFSSFHFLVLIPDVSSAMVLVRVALGDCLYPYSGVAMVLLSLSLILSRCAWRCST